MHIFAYSKEWADLVVAQISTSHRTRCAAAWGYGCIVVGKEFEGVIERNWEAVNRIAGPYLHIFALIPPPKDFVGSRLRALKDSPPSDDREFAIERYTNLLRQPDPNRSYLIKEKVLLLTDLRNAGLKADQYADFLFFEFRNEGADVTIDVVAAKSAAIDAPADDMEYLKCIERMAHLAKKHYQRSSSVHVLVKDMALLWDAKISILKAMGLFSYMKDFVKNITSTQ